MSSKKGASFSPVAGARWRLGRRGLLLVAAVVAACGASSCRRAPEPIRILGEGYPPLLALEKASAEFTAETGIKIEFVKKDHPAVVAEVNREAIAGSTSYDIVVLPHRLLGRVVAHGYARRLGSKSGGPDINVPRRMFEDDYYLPKWFSECCSVRDDVYGLPFMALSMYLWYREDLFGSAAERANFERRYGRPLEVPRNWQEYEQCAEFFFRPQVPLYGVSLQGQRHIALWYEWLSYLIGFRGRILDVEHGWEYGRVALGDPEAGAATAYYIGLRRFASPDTPNYNWDDALTLFQQGKVAMGIMWHDSAPWIEDPTVSQVAGRIGYALPPAADGKPRIQLEAHTFVLPMKSERQNDAAHFLAWALSRPAQVRQATLGGLPPVAEVYQEPGVRAKKYLLAFSRMASFAVPKPTVPESPAISEAIEAQLANAMAGTVAPEAALAHATREVTRIVANREPPR